MLFTKRLLSFAALSVLCLFASAFPFTLSNGLVSNQGQWPDSVLFRANLEDKIVWVLQNGICYQIFTRTPGIDSSAGIQEHLPYGRLRSPVGLWQSTLVLVRFDGSNPDVAVTCQGQLEPKYNFFLGTDSDRWVSGVKSYKQVTLHNIYDGVDFYIEQKDNDLSCRFSGSELALRDVRTVVEGGTAVQVDSGDAIVSTKLGNQHIQLPVSCRTLDGANSIPLASPTVDPYRTDKLGATGTTEETGRVLLLFSTLLGGNMWDFAYDIALADDGDVVLVGETESEDFPVTGGFDTVFNLNSDVMVVRLDGDGSNIEWATFIGGRDLDYAMAVDLDPQGNAYIAGSTTSANFPSVNQIRHDKLDLGAFIAKLTAAGDGLTYCSVVGADYASDVTVDSVGNAVMCGVSSIDNLPMLNCLDCEFSGQADGFISKIASSGQSFVYSTYLGGSGYDRITAMWQCTDGSVWVTGITASSDYPVIKGIDSSIAGQSDMFISSLSADGLEMLFSTYWGGASGEVGTSIYADSIGNCFVVGTTNSTDLYTSDFSDSTYNGGDNDSFLLRLKTSNGEVGYSTYLGGSSWDEPSSVRVGVDGEVVISGMTASADFPLVNPIDSQMSQGEGTVVVFDSKTDSVMFSTFLGGTFDDQIYAVDLDESGNLFLVGRTNSPDFQLVNPIESLLQDWDAFACKLGGWTGCCMGFTGNVNGSGSTDLSDLSYLVAFLTATSRPSITCWAEANINGSGQIDLSDLSLLINYLTLTPKPTLPECSD